MSNPGSKLFALISAVVLMGAMTGSTIAQNRADDEEAIRRVVTAMDDAFNTHMPDSSLFTKDADFVNVNGTWLKGASEIDSGRRTAFETRLKNARTKSLDLHIRFVRPDVAIVHATSETSGITTADGRELPPQRELNIRVLTKEDGRWLVTALHNTPLRQ